MISRSIPDLKEAVGLLMGILLFLTLFSNRNRELSTVSFLKDRNGVPETKSLLLHSLAAIVQKGGLKCTLATLVFLICCAIPKGPGVVVILHASVWLNVRAIATKFGAESSRIRAEDLVSAPFSFSVCSSQGADQRANCLPRYGGWSGELIASPRPYRSTSCTVPPSPCKRRHLSAPPTGNAHTRVSNLKPTEKKSWTKLLKAPSSHLLHKLKPLQYPLLLQSWEHFFPLLAALICCMVWWQAEQCVGIDLVCSWDVCYYFIQQIIPRY